MKNKLIPMVILIFCLIISCKSQEKKEFRFTQAELDEFELLNQCHCLEYLRLRSYDFVKWKSESAKEKYLEEIRGLVFSQFSTLRLHSQYYQEKYDSSLFLKHGTSIYTDGTKLNFHRLDSLYYEPIVQQYIIEQTKTESLPYLGLDYNFFIDCYYRVKQIPLEIELRHFIDANPQFKREN